MSVFKAKIRCSGFFFFLNMQKSAHNSKAHFNTSQASVDISSRPSKISSIYAQKHKIKNKSPVCTLSSCKKEKKNPALQHTIFFEHAILAIYKNNPIIEVYKAHISHTLLKVFTLFPIESFILRTRCKQS